MFNGDITDTGERDRLEPRTLDAANEGIALSAFALDTGNVPDGEPCHAAKEYGYECAGEGDLPGDEYERE
jgi:hypothetical protein